MFLLDTNIISELIKKQPNPYLFTDDCLLTCACRLKRSAPSPQYGFAPRSELSSSYKPDVLDIQHIFFRIRSLHKPEAFVVPVRIVRPNLPVIYPHGDLDPFPRPGPPAAVQETQDAVLPLVQGVQEIPRLDGIELHRRKTVHSSDTEERPLVQAWTVGEPKGQAEGSLK